MNGKVANYSNLSLTKRLCSKWGTFGDGEKPTARLGGNLYVVNCDWTISPVGWAGHMACQSAKSVGEQELIRVDYEKYL